MTSDPGPDRSVLAALPKVDLHRHLEGSLRVETVRELAAAGAVPLPPKLDDLRPLISLSGSDPQNREYFLGRFANIREVFQTAEIIRRISREAVLDARADNVRYLELHLTPVALAAASGGSYRQVIEWVRQGVDSVEDRGTMVRLVVSVNRHEPTDLAAAVARTAQEAQELGVVALDLAGDEGAYPGEPFREVFTEAKAAGLGISIHAGEWAGPASVREAIEVLGADRIAHGIRVMEDKEAVIAARDRRVPFAVCLTSNVQTGVVERLEDHPLPHMIQAGLQVSLNSDDPGVSRISLTGEYARALAQLDLSHQSLQGLVLAGAQAAFLPKRDKADLVASLQRELGLAPRVEAQEEGGS